MNLPRATSSDAGQPSAAARGWGEIASPLAGRVYGMGLLPHRPQERLHARPSRLRVVRVEQEGLCDRQTESGRRNTNPAASAGHTGNMRGRAAESGFFLHLPST